MDDLDRNTHNAVRLEAIGRQFTLDDIEEIKDHVGGVEFQQAAREGNLKIVKRYLSSKHFKRRMEKFKEGKGAQNPIDGLDSQGAGAMHYAARYNNVQIMDLLLEYGADINLRDEDGQTPLHHATRYAPKGTALNPIQVMYVPMQPGLQEDDVLEDEDQDKSTGEPDVLQDLEEAAQTAAGDAAVLAIKKFLKRSDTKRVKTLEDQIAEEEGSPPVRFLAERKADVNAQDDYGLTALHCAADRGNYPAVLELIKIDSILIDIQDKQGETALHMAVMFEDLPCIKKLLFNKKHPCNPRIYSYTGMSPLHLASREAELEVVELVFDRIKTVEIKESLDSILKDSNAESKQIRAMCAALGVPNVANYHKHISSLMRKLHAKAKEDNPDDYAAVKRMIDQKFQKAMNDTDYKMKEYINRAGEEKNTCLHLACKDGRPDVVDFLVSNGADMNATSSERETCLHIAAHKGHIEVVEKLVEMNCPKEAKNLDGETALHEASKANQTEIIEYLLTSGAEIDAKDKHGSTPLITAAAWGQEESVKLLLESGADVNARDKRENSAVFAAIRENEPDVLTLILDTGGSRLIDSELDKFQNTPLHFAAEQGHLQCLKILLDFGFETNAQNEDDKCALHLACEHGRKKCAQELVKKDKSTLEDKDDLGNIPLHYCSLNGHVETTLYLCDMGAEVGARNQNGWTPLDCAASNGNTKTMAALIDSDAEIDPIDKARLTPLHLAAKNGHVDAVEYLLNNGADIRLVDVHDLNALELAVLANKRDVAEAIINHGANDAYSSHAGETWMKALTNAQQNGDTPMKKLIRKMPHIAELVLNKCTNLKNNPPDRTTDHPNFEVQFNYGYISEKSGFDPNNDDSKSTNSDHEDSDAGSKVMVLPHSTDSFHIHPLNLMIKFKRNELLSHPLVTSLIFHKWTTYGKHFYFGNLLIYILYLLCITLYAVYQIAPFGSVWNDEAGEEGEWEKEQNCIADSPGCNMDNVKPLIVTISGLGVMALSIVRILIELLQLWYQKHRYFTLQNFTEIALFALSIYFTSNVFFKLKVISEPQWQLGVVCLLVAWMNLLMFLRKFPGIGIYIVMFVAVLQTFLKIMVVMTIFIVAFGLTFNMVMAQYPAYEEPGYSIIRSFVMMTGEIEFDSYFIPGALKDPTPLYYPESTFLMFVVFVIIVPIVFMNLLVGLAVDDIKEVYKEAELQRSIMKIQLIFQVEVLLPANYLENQNNSRKTFYPNKRSKILGSKALSKYVGPHQLPFNGADLSGRVVDDASHDSQMLLDSVKLKKMKKQMTQITKQNKIMITLLKRMVRKQRADDDSVISSDFNDILGAEDSDMEMNAED